MGKVVQELQNKEIREIIYRNFRVVYRIKENNLEIVRIIHGSRLLKI